MRQLKKRITSHISIWYVSMEEKKPSCTTARCLQAARLHNHLRDDVRVHVRRGATVFEIADLLSLGIPRNTHRTPTVRYTVGELIDRSRLVRSGQPPLVPLAVGIDGRHVIRAELLNRGDDLAVSLVWRVPGVAFIAHLLGREVRVAPRSVPISSARLRVESHGNLEVLADALHDVARHPHVIAAVDALARPNLVLPLARHDLRVRTGDGESSPQAHLVVSLRDNAAEGNSISAAAVVRALGTCGFTLVREPERYLLSGLEERVLLLDPEPRNLILRFRHDLRASSTLVALHRKLRLRVESLAQDQLVRVSAERIVEHGHRADEDLRI